jgi:hypothetical protein
MLRLNCQTASKSSSSLASFCNLQFAICILQCLYRSSGSSKYVYPCNPSS